MEQLPKPTDSELEILQVLWQRGACTVREVNDELLARDEQARTHVYRAVAQEQATQRQLLDRFVDSVFQGSALNLVMQALGKSRTSADELREIRKLIDDMENEQKGGAK